jgi:hypothetical protein
MASRKNQGGVVEDIRMNTLLGTDDFGPIAPTGPDAPASWEEVEETTILLNPDSESMDYRG